MARFAFAVVVVCTATILADPAGTPDSPVPSPAAPEQPFHGIHVDPEAGTLEVEAIVVRQYGQLELVACVAAGKRHEALLVLKTTPVEFNLACLAAGLEPPREPGADGPDGLGSRVRMDVAWLAGEGDEQAEVLKPLESLVWNRVLQQSLQTDGWYYMGGMFTTVRYYDEHDQIQEKELYVPEATGTLISLACDPNAVLSPSPHDDLPKVPAGAPEERFVGWDDYIAYEPELPEQFTEATLVIRRWPQGDAGDGPEGE